MGDVTTISWSQATFNGWIGCQKVGPGCDNCYAEARDIRFEGGQHWGPGAPRRRTSAANWRKPYRWDRLAREAGVRTRVFCSSLADVFDNAIDPQWRRDLAQVIRDTPQLDWMLLTKRIGNVPRMVEDDFGGSLPGHVWLGASVVTQAEADRDISRLLAVPAAIRWLSMEPLLERIEIAPDQMAALDMVVVGGESGPRARPMPLDWARDLLRQARTGGTAFHFKQMSEADSPSDYGDVEAFPEDLRVRELPLAS
jgi:protein gp37